MAFCGQIATNLTDSDLQAIYGTSTKPALLPHGGFSDSDRDGRGLLKSDVLTTTVASMTASGRIPKPPPMSATSNEGKTVEEYMTKDRAFIDDIKLEYCFYDSRYRYALQQLFSKLEAGYTQANQQNQQLTNTYLAASTALNKRLNDLTQLCNEIAKSRLKYTQEQNTQINSLNTDLATRSDKLTEQNKILSSQQATAVLYKDMVKYTKERADSTNNMLTLYSFMNVVMVGLLVYLYRSASS
jgi:hypothetical protein